MRILYAIYIHNHFKFKLCYTVVWHTGFHVFYCCPSVIRHLFYMLLSFCVLQGPTYVSHFLPLKLKTLLTYASSYFESLKISHIINVPLSNLQLWKKGGRSTDGSCSQLQLVEPRPKGLIPGIEIEYARCMTKELSHSHLTYFGVPLSGSSSNEP